MSKMKYFQFYTSLWRTGKIQLFTMEEQGIFVNLCAMILDNGGTLCVDAFTHRMMRINEHTFNECVRALTDAGLVLNNDGVLSVKFITEQVETYRAKCAQNSIAGRLSAQSRQRASTNKNRIDKKRVDKKEDICAFEEFWKLYDKKRDKQKALKLWSKLAQTDRDEIMLALPPYIKATPDKQYRKDPTTYLRNRCWEDEIIIKGNGKGNGNGTTRQTMTAMPTDADYEAQQTIGVDENGDPVF